MNKRLKNLLLVIFVLVFATFSLTGCGTSTQSSTTNNDQQPPSNANGGPGGPGGPEKKVDTSNITHKWLDVAYAQKSEAEKLDIYLPNKGNGPFPVILSIHGGGFALGDKQGIELTSALKALDKGYAVIAVNYRLSGEATFPAQINDIKAAIRFVRANADKYSLNTNKIAVWGSSAGGNLAALAGTSAGVKSLTDLSLGNPTQSDAVQAVVDWFGPINFLTMDEQFKASGIQGQTHNSSDSFESKLLGQTITKVPDLVKAVNPETYISTDDPPFFIQHGTADKNVPTQQSVNFAAQLTKTLGKDKVTFEKIEGAGHGGSQFDATENLNKVFTFLDKNLK